MPTHPCLPLDEYLMATDPPHTYPFFISHVPSQILPLTQTSSISSRSHPAPPPQPPALLTTSQREEASLSLPLSSSTLFLPPQEHPWSHPPRPLTNNLLG